MGGVAHIWWGRLVIRSPRTPSHLLRRSSPSRASPGAREPEPHKLRLPLEGELPQGFIPEGERGTTLADS